MTWRTLAASVAAEAARREGRWDDARFRGLVAAVAPTLEASVEGDAAAVRAWLEAVAEAVLRDRLGGPTPQGWTSFGEHALLALLPDHLGDLDPAARVAAVARVFNLVEGLAGHAAWVDRYVLSKARDDTRLDELDAWLVDVLEPLVDDLPPPRWRGPYAVRWLDCAAADAAFLPGDLAMVTPSVVAVADRRRPGTLAIRVAPGGDNQLLGTGPDALSEAPVGGPEVVLLEGALLIAGVRVELPAVPAPRRALATPAGVVVVTAEDSQRLWLVAAP